jgi:hypothetical protein
MRPARYFVGWLLVCIAPFMFLAVGLGADGLSWTGFIVAEVLFAGGPLALGIPSG